MKPAMTERAALPVHSTRSSVTSTLQEFGGVHIERVLGVTAGAGQEHQVTALGALDDHGSDNGHEETAESVPAGIPVQLVQRVPLHAQPAQGVVVVGQQLGLMGSPVFGGETAADEE